MRNPLLDLDFLKALDENRDQVTYAKIILLTFDEQPISEIQGRVTSGSVNIDGNSAVRRTCSLSMVTNDKDINETYWVLKNKFKLEIGVENHINPNYPDIIWFKQGLFVFSSISMSVQAQNYTINLQGKDKMCLLNGELGGAITAQTDFGKIDEYETLGSGEIIKNTREIPIQQIVKEAVHLYGGQPLEDIVLNDINEYGLELLSYRGEKPIYFIRNTNGMVTNVVVNPSHKCYYGTGENDYYYINEVPVYYNLSPTADNSGATLFAAAANTDETSQSTYNVIKVEKNETCGYRLTDLTYPGDLVCNVGEAITSMLDKIKNMFSDFEYFYDIDGRFIFQKKKTYVNTSWNNLTTSNEEIYAEDAAYTSSTVYSFEQGVLLSAFNNQPQINNIKNDFSIWGNRKGAGDAQLPIHLRYAIDFKPEYYKPVRWDRDLDGNLTDVGRIDTNIFYCTKEWDLAYPDTTQPAAASSLTRKVVDWREIIYQMAQDFYAFDYRIEDFKQILADENSDYYPTGKTGYENYYMDLQSFWRQLYYPDYEIVKYREKLIAKADRDKINGTLTETEYKKREEEINKEIEALEDEFTNSFWSTTVSEYPETLNFWFDFLDVRGAELDKYSVHSIGRRPKAVNDDKVKAIYYKETPQVIFMSQDELNTSLNHYKGMTGYTFIPMNGQLENYFTISSQGQSAQDKLDSLLYQHTYANENVTMTSVPIYYLQPNNRVLVLDKDTNTNGEYIVTKITIPLQYNGTSSITATKAVERIY